MAKTATKWVTLKTGITVPAAVMRSKDDEPLPHGAVVELPASYADHLVSDGYATLSEAPKPEKRKAPAKSNGGGQPTGKAEQMKLAQQAVDDARAALDAAEGTDEEAQAQAALTEAQAALDALTA
jgi:hypothetical protein